MLWQVRKTLNWYLKYWSLNNISTSNDDAAHFGQHDLSHLNILLLNVNIGWFLSDLAQFPVDAGVEEDQGEERNDAVDHKIEINNVDLVVIGVLSQLGSNNDEILKNHY